MTKPLDDDFNYTVASSKITEGGTVKQSKGGVYAPADVELIKNALTFYIQEKDGIISQAEKKQIANLLHRLNNRI